MVKAVRRSLRFLDNSVRLPARSTEARKAFSQYISRRMAVPPPLSLKKMSIRDNGEATVISYTSDNEFFQGKTHPFSVMRFLLVHTQHVPPRRSQYIRRYGLYASRTKGKWPDISGAPSPCDAVRSWWMEI